MNMMKHFIVAAGLLFGTSCKPDALEVATVLQDLDQYVGNRVAGLRAGIGEVEVAQPLDGVGHDAGVGQILRAECVSGGIQLRHGRGLDWRSY